MDKSKLNEIRQIFQPFIDKMQPMGILLFGSQVDESPSAKSDVDICIVNPQSDIKENLAEAWRVVGGKYDLWIFEELPVYMKAEVLDKHQIMYTPDEMELYEYFYYYEKLVQTYRYRLRVAYGEF